MAIHLYLEESDLSLCLPEPCFWESCVPGTKTGWQTGSYVNWVTISSCIPEFWMALVLILIFSVNLKILPSSGAYSTGNAGDVGDRVDSSDHAFDHRGSGASVVLCLHDPK